MAILLDLFTLSSFQLTLADFCQSGAIRALSSTCPTRRHHHTTRATLRTNDLPQPATTYRTFYARIQHDGIHTTWCNNTEVLLVRVSTITKAMKAKIACVAEQFMPLMHTNVSCASHTKKAVSQRGEYLVFPLYCCTEHGLRDSLIKYKLDRVSFLAFTI